MEQKILHSEIQALEAKLEAKKKELAGGELEARPERHLLKDVIQEHAGFSAPAVVNYSTSSKPVQKRVATTEETDQLERLIEHAFTKGLRSAVNESKKTNNPFLIDSLHDQLTDIYYEKLLNARRIQKN